MNCPAFERLAAAASGEDDAILAHLDDCADCQHLVEEQGAMRLLASHAPSAPLTRAHREDLAAEVMAQADWMPLRKRRMVRMIMPLAAGLAAAAGIAIAIGLGALGPFGADERAEVADLVVPEPPAHVPTVTPIITPTVTPIETVVVRDAPRPTTIVVKHAKLDGSADYSRKVTGEREIVNLTGGELTVDALDARQIQILTGDTAISVKRAKLKVIATKGAIAQVSVFAGTAEITVNGKTQIIEAGMVWDRPATPADSSVAFQEGWVALRDGNNIEAIAAFDRAVDPIVAPEALYWGAIASERIQDPAGAKQRYEVLVNRFPKSPYARKAEKALGRLEK